MTSSSRRFALKAALVAALAAAFAGCDKPDGRQEFAAGRAAYEVRDLKKAEKMLEKSLSHNATNVDALVTYAMVKIDLGEIPLAEDAISKAAAIAGGDIDVRLLGANIAYYLNDYKRAHKAFVEMANDASLNASLRSQAFAGAGVVELMNNEIDQARLSFLKAARLNGKNAAAWYHLGRIYLTLGYYEYSRDQFNNFVHLNDIADRRVQDVQRKTLPMIKEAIARKASEHPGAGNRDSAAASKALEAAESAWTRQQFKTAKSRYQEALTADPLSYPAALGLARVWEKTDASPAGQKKALEFYQIACSLNSDAVSTFLTTADLAMKQKHYATARELYSRAMAADPRNITAIDGHIRALRKVGGMDSVANAYQAYRDMITAKKR